METNEKRPEHEMRAWLNVAENRLNALREQFGAEAVDAALESIAEREDEDEPFFR